LRDLFTDKGLKAMNKILASLSPVLKLPILNLPTPVKPRGCLILTLLLFLTSGCASYGVIHNELSQENSNETRYALKTWADNPRVDDFVFILAFSGGGTRAATMAYGVLEELRDTVIDIEGQPVRLLDKVTHISSVSGGSFTSAYYGLYGDQIFDNFESEFLRKDVERALTWSVLRPVHWFTRKGRTERAVEYYNKILFHDKTFADMLNPGRPMIVINASDLAWGIRFSFIQEYFDLLCSDLLTFPVASAVAASSAVPVVFNPVVIENYPGCKPFESSPQARQLASQSNELTSMFKGMESYNDKEERKYIQFVDGGITDNMGLRAMTDVVAISGGPGAMISKMRRTVPRHVVFLSVNASTEYHSDMNKTTRQPSMLTSMNAMTDVQLHRYNAATVDKVRSSLSAWAQHMSTPETPVRPYFIEVAFDQVAQPQLKYFLNKLPTSFSLTDEQVDTLITTARTLLRDNPEFNQLISDLSSP
jgi:NTE family protein